MKQLRLAMWRAEELHKHHRKQRKAQKKFEKQLKEEREEFERHLEEMRLNDEMLLMAMSSAPSRKFVRKPKLEKLKETNKEKSFDLEKSFKAMFAPKDKQVATKSKEVSKSNDRVKATNPKPAVTKKKSKTKAPSVMETLDREVAEMMSMKRVKSREPSLNQSKSKQHSLEHKQPQPQYTYQPEPKKGFDGPEWDNYRELYNSLPMEAKMTIDKQIEISKTDKLEWVKAFEPSLRKMLTKQKHRAPNRSYGYSTPAPSFR